MEEADPGRCPFHSFYLSGKRGIKSQSLPEERLGPHCPCSQAWVHVQWIWIFYQGLKWCCKAQGYLGGIGFNWNNDTLKSVPKSSSLKWDSLIFKPTVLQVSQEGLCWLTGEALLHGSHSGAQNVLGISWIFPEGWAECGIPLKTSHPKTQTPHNVTSAHIPLVKASHMAKFNINRVGYYTPLISVEVAGRNCLWSKYLNV